MPNMFRGLTRTRACRLSSRKLVFEKVSFLCNDLSEPVLEFSFCQKKSSHTLSISKIFTKRFVMYRKIYVTIYLLLYFTIQGPEAYSQQLTSAVKQFVSINADTIALMHAAVIDGTGSPLKNDQVIVIIKGRIVKTGNAN